MTAKKKTIHDVLFDIQQNLEAAKDQYNSFGKYKYRSCEGVLASLKPLLEKHGATLTLSDIMSHVGTRHYVVAEAVLSFGGERVCTTAYAREAEVQKGMNDAQITGSASSYARKYALNGLFAIDDTKDPDATNTHGKRAKVTDGDHFRKKVCQSFACWSEVDGLTENAAEFKAEAEELGLTDWLYDEFNRTKEAIDMDNRGSNS